MQNRRPSANPEAKTRVTQSGILKHFHVGPLGCGLAGNMDGGPVIGDEATTGLSFQPVLLGKSFFVPFPHHTDEWICTCKAESSSQK